MTRLLILFGIMLPLLALLTWMCGRTLIDKDSPKPIRILAWGIIIALALCVPAHFIMRGLIMNKSQLPSFTLLNYGMGLYSLLVIGVIIRNIIIGMMVAWQKLNKKQGLRFSSDHQRRQYLKKIANIGVVTWAGGFFAYAARKAAGDPTLVKVDIPLKTLPMDLDGLTIAQISDLHIGQILDPHYFEKIVKLINSQSPDLIVITGDMVDGTVKQLGNLALTLKPLQSRYGQWFITGNHEYYSGAADWLNFIEQQLGWKTLQNRHEIISVTGKSGASYPLAMIGVNDYKAQQFDPSASCEPAKAFANLPSQLAARIFLAHQPKTANIHQYPVDLQLSGHTHAGQYFPATWLVHFVQPYVGGLCQKKLDNSWIYVNRGTGYWGPALRSTEIVGEVTLLTLRHQA